MMKILAYLVFVALMSGCIASQESVCLDGSTVDDANDCTNTTARTGTSSIDPSYGCERFRTTGGEPDELLIARCRMRNAPTKEHCLSMTPVGAFGRDRCLMEAAALTNDTGLCDGFVGNMRIMCEAEADKDILECGNIMVQDLREQCKGDVAALAPAKSHEADCSDKEGDERAWCILYRSQKAEDCLSIDDSKYRDEASFCVARAERNQTMCDRITDSVMMNLCRKTVVGV